MTKISVNKIPFDGPKTHNQILEKIRSDLAKTQNSISMERVTLIVSSFFGKEVLFKDIPKKETIWSSFIGTFYPGRMKPKIYRERAIRKIKHNAVKRFLEDREVRIAFSIKNKMIIKYNKWRDGRDERGSPFISLGEYMVYRHLRFPNKRKVTEDQIRKNLYRYNDQGEMIIKRKSKEMKKHFAERDAKIKAEKALPDQH